MAYSDDLADLRSGSLSFDDFARRNASTFRRWAAHFFTRWPQSTLDIEDLVQEGMIEAWRAVDAWEPDRGTTLRQWVEYHVGRKLRVELERVLGWPKKSRDHKAVRPVSMAVRHVDHAVRSKMIDRSIAPPERAELEEAVEAVDDPMVRDVVAGVGLGMSIRTVAARIYADPERRLAYRLDSDEHALLRAHAAARKAIREFVHPGGLAG